MLILETSIRKIYKLCICECPHIEHSSKFSVCSVMVIVDISSVVGAVGQGRLLSLCVLNGNSCPRHEASVTLPCQFGQSQYWQLPACDSHLIVSVYISRMYM